MVEEEVVVVAVPLEMEVLEVVLDIMVLLELEIHQR